MPPTAEDVLTGLGLPDETACNSSALIASFEPPIDRLDGPARSSATIGRIDPAGHGDTLGGGQASGEGVDRCLRSDSIGQDDIVKPSPGIDARAQRLDDRRILLVQKGASWT